MTLSKNCVLTDEVLVYSDRWAEVDRDLYGQETVVTAMFQYLLDFFVGQATLVISTHWYLPGLQRAFLPLILPEDLRVVGDVLVLTTARVCGRRCLASHEAIAHNLVAFQSWELPPSRCP